MTKLAIIGGTGALDLFHPSGPAIENTVTRWGPASMAPVPVDLGSTQAWFLARHGRPHHIPPHRINYRANIELLQTLGARHVVAINAVGGIAPELAAGDLVMPDQLIDYTWGRDHSFSDDAVQPLRHIEFAQPFAGPAGDALRRAAARTDIDLQLGACYGVTQGPRLETAAEITRLAADGCTVVGMTAMPEAALAREAGLDYASVCVVANPAARVDAEPISMAEIHRVLAQSMASVVRLLEAWAEEM